MKVGLSASLPTDETPADQACPVPRDVSRTEDLDALVDAFLDELNSLSGEQGVASPPTCSEVPKRAVEIDARAGVFGSTGSFLPSEPEDVPPVQQVESAGISKPMEGSQLETVDLTPPLEAVTANIGLAREEARVSQDTLVPHRSPEPEVNETEGMPPSEMPPTVEAGLVPQNEAAPGSLFQAQRRDRGSLYRTAVIVLISVAVLTACYFFFGFTKSAGTPNKRSDAQPASVAAPARTDSPRDSDMPIWPAGSDTLAIPGSGVTEVQPDAGVLQITQPVATRKVMPPYPKAAKSLGIDGPVEVDVSADLDDKGNVLRATAMEGPEVFRSAAEEALMNWSFKPAADKGVNIRSTVRVTIVFKP